MNKAVKSTLALAGTIAIAGATVAPASVFAWGDNGGYRPSYTIADIDDGALGDKIVFNSISNSVIGDEKNFVSARETNSTAEYWNGNDITVKDGQEYYVRLYVHNNSPKGWDAVSKNTRVAFNIPTISAKQIQVNGYIYSDNATPSQYWDYVNFNSDKAFHLEYVYGSALIENRGFASKDNGGAKPLGDEIVTDAPNGVKIGYNSLNGEVPGCYQFDETITIRVKAVFDTEYRIEQKMRLAGTKEWSYSVNANVGDKVEVKVEYINESNESQRDVMIRDVLPKNLRYVPGTTTLYSTKYPNGAVYQQDDIITTGINIGHYAAGANAVIRFTTEVVDNTLQCGSNTLVNWVRGTVNQKTIQDYSTVVLKKVCENNNNETPNVSELPNTGPEALAGGAIAAGSVVTAAGYYIASRRNLRK